MGVGPAMTGVARRAVFLDRDGVLNRSVVRDGKPYPPASLAELEIIPEAHDAVRRLRDAGFALFVVSNQPDVARGTQRREVVEALNAAIAHALPLDGFFICYHDDAAGCDCRKPQPGLILDAAREHGVDLRASFAVGDRWRDVEAATRAGVRSVFVDYGYAERRPHAPDAVVDSISAAATWIVDAALQPLETGHSSAPLRGGLDP
jgi:D-glycero-D-manno-heptose 1,7-bisphosphate phosphatase